MIEKIPVESLFYLNINLLTPCYPQVTFDQNFDFRRDHNKKNPMSAEYESVEGRNLSLVISRISMESISNIYGKMNPGVKRLIITTYQLRLHMNFISRH